MYESIKTSTLVYYCYYYFSGHGKKECLKLLLTQQDPGNDTEKENWTALMLAAGK